MENQPIRLIIADDHAIFRDGLRRLLATQPDFQVIGEASDGKEAISLAQSMKPDVLLLDLAMPRVPGMEVLRELSRQQTPVRTILLTAAIQPFAVTSALQLGARGIVLKASPPEMLLKSIRSVHEGQFWVGSEPVSSWAKPGQSTSGFGLTSREVEIISAIKKGSSNREIAGQLAISEETVKRHLSNIYGKLGVSSRLELAVLASEQHLGIEP
ncbi:MAG TPA: response regulator transcription factor [Terriglobales bacterium]|jgi:two-component system nitrate/nitrite response regulator NarL|nr:response regulator transcription factor [Terriglobales bacterium]